jgi:hypothetical protein
MIGNTSIFDQDWELHNIKFGESIPYLYQVRSYLIISLNSIYRIGGAVIHTGGACINCLNIYSKNRSMGNYRLLIFDGYDSHGTVQFVTYVYEYNIILLYFDGGYCTQIELMGQQTR